VVAGEFVLGMLVATAIGIPVVDQVFDVGSWLFASPLVHLAGGILVIGIVQEALKYLTVRLSVYNSREFDERTDGIIYGTAVGLGFATALNVAFVVESGGVDLGTGAIRIVLTSLAHASFGGVIGYFLGRQKFEPRPIWWMPAGVALAAILNGVFFFLRSTVGRGTIEGPLDAVAPWIGLILAALLAAAVTAVLSTLIRRELAQTAAGAGAPS
jgi:RsiW-degrading membrane proteinase PrsW (M82 family)